MVASVSDSIGRDTMTDLIPAKIPRCNFCKEDAYLAEVRGVFHIECLNSNCGLCGPKFLRASEAIEAWRRIRFTSIEEEIRQDAKEFVSKAYSGLCSLIEKRLRR